MVNTGSIQTSGFTPNTATKVTGSRMSNTTLFFIIVIVLGFTIMAAGTAWAFIRSGTCKKQTNCKTHVNKLINFAWFLPQSLGGERCIDDDIDVPANVTPDLDTDEEDDPEENYLKCESPDDNYYINDDGYAVPITVCDDVNQYTKKEAEDGKDTVCGTCNPINNLDPSINIVCSEGSTQSSPGPSKIKSGQTYPVGKLSYCQDGYTLRVNTGSSDTCEACGTITNALSTSQVLCKDDTTETNMENIVKKFDTASTVACENNYIKVTGTTTESDTCQACDSVKVDSVNSNNWSQANDANTSLFLLFDTWRNELESGTTTPSTLQGYDSTGNKNWNFVLKADPPATLVTNNNVWSGCSINNNVVQPCDEFFCTGNGLAGNTWVSHYIERDTTDTKKYSCKPCTMEGVKTDLDTEGKIIGSKTACKSGKGTYFLQTANLTGANSGVTCPSETDIISDDNVCVGDCTIITKNGRKMCGMGNKGVYERPSGTTIDAFCTASAEDTVDPCAAFTAGDEASCTGIEGCTYTAPVAAVTGVDAVTAVEEACTPTADSSGR